MRQQRRQQLTAVLLLLLLLLLLMLMLMLSFFSLSFSNFFPSYLLSSPFCSLSLLVVTQIRGHTAGSSPLLPTYGSCLAFFIARRFQIFLPSSTSAELCSPTLGALTTPVDPFFSDVSNIPNSVHIGVYLVLYQGIYTFTYTVCTTCDTTGGVHKKRRKSTHQVFFGVPDRGRGGILQASTHIHIF